MLVIGAVSVNLNNNSGLKVFKFNSVKHQLYFYNYTKVFFFYTFICLFSLMYKYNFSIFFFESKILKSKLKLIN